MTCFILPVHPFFPRASWDFSHSNPLVTSLQPRNTTQHVLFGFLLLLASLDCETNREVVGVRPKAPWFTPCLLTSGSPRGCQALGFSCLSLLSPIFFGVFIEVGIQGGNRQTSEPWWSRAESSCGTLTASSRPHVVSGASVFESWTCVEPVCIEPASNRKLTSAQRSEVEFSCCLNQCAWIEAKAANPSKKAGKQSHSQRSCTQIKI